MKKKINVSKLFLYRHRFLIGYLVLGIIYVAMLFTLPFVAMTGVSRAEMDSAVGSYVLSVDAPMSGDLVDLPYRVLQKLSIMILGLSPFAVKLPSILVGLVLGLILVLLLNRWFKNNVSLMASCLIILSTPFLFLAGSGTPLIMIVFWPTLLLWLGSKIQGEKRPKPMYSLLFAIAMLLSIFTPFMLYFAAFSVIFVLLQPHLRFIVKSLPKLPLAGVGLIIIAGVSALVMNMINHPETIMELLLAPGLSFDQIFPNILKGLTLLFTWRGSVDSVFLTPLMSLPLFAMALIGLFSTTKGFFASRNSIASLLIVFTLIITAFRPEAVIFFILPFAILTAHGLKYLLEKWYGLFPENPYARLAALLPLTALYLVMIVPSLTQFMYGYKYNPDVVRNFSYTLALIQDNLETEVVVAPENTDFYKILEPSRELAVVQNLESAMPGDTIAVLGRTAVEAGLSEAASARENQTLSEAERVTIRTGLEQKYELKRIIASPLRENSDIIYIYTVKGE